MFDMQHTFQYISHFTLHYAWHDALLLHFTSLYTTSNPKYLYKHIYIPSHYGHTNTYTHPYPQMNTCTHTTLQCALHTLNTLQIAGSTPSSISPTPALRGRSQASEGSWLGKSGVHRHNLPNEDVCAGHTPPWPLGIKIAAWNWHRLQFELELLRYEWDKLSGAKWYTP